MALRDVFILKEENYWEQSAESRTVPEQYIEMVPIKQLMFIREFDWNKHSEKESQKVGYVADDISKNGIKNPLLIYYWYDDGHIMLGNGNHRLAAAANIGMTHVPAVVCIVGGSGYAHSKRNKSHFQTLPSPKHTLKKNGYLRPSEVGFAGTPVKKF